jgi:hypothetical protein
MTTDSTLRTIPLFIKSDDVANEKAGAQIHEHLLSFLIIGIETGSIKTIVRTDETINKKPTKRLGEVDYTIGRIFIITIAYSAKKHNHQYQRLNK